MSMKELLLPSCKLGDQSFLTSNSNRGLFLKWTKRLTLPQTQGNFLLADCVELGHWSFPTFGFEPKHGIFLPDFKLELHHWLLWVSRLLTGDPGIDQGLHSCAIQFLTLLSFYMKELVLCLRTLANTQWEPWMVSKCRSCIITTSGRKARQQNPEGPEPRQQLCGHHSIWGTGVGKAGPAPS